MSFIACTWKPMRDVEIHYELHLYKCGYCALKESVPEVTLPTNISTAKFWSAWGQSFGESNLIGRVWIIGFFTLHDANLSCQLTLFVRFPPYDNTLSLLQSLFLAVLEPADFYFFPNMEKYLKDRSFNTAPGKIADCPYLAYRKQFPYCTE